MTLSPIQALFPCVSWILLLAPVFAAAQNRPPAPAPQISDFVLYAERSIKMGHRSHTEGGEVGVRTALMQTREGKAQLQLEEHAKCGNSFSPSISLESDAEIGKVWTNSLKRVKDTEIGPDGSFPAASMPPLPLASASGSGQDIHVEEHKTRSITPGTYGAVVIEEHGTLRLAAGTYTFTSVKMGGDSKILGDRGGVVERGNVGAPASGLWVRILNDLQMGEEAKIQPAWDDAKAKDFIISVAGNDPSKIEDKTLGPPTTRLTPTTVVSMAHKAHVHGLLAAPHGTIWMAEDSGGKGAFAAFDIVLAEHVEVEFESGFSASMPGQQGSQQLHGYFGPPPNPSVAALVGPVESSTKLNLSIGLPIRDPNGLQNFINKVSDPTSPSYRHYLTLPQFTATYGATSSDYNAVVSWASSHGLNVNSTYSNNLLIDVSGTAAQVEQALYANLVYRLRRDGSRFVAVDRDPSLDLTPTILRVSGLDSFVTPKPAQGSAPGGGLWGWDFRNAYLGIGTPCSSLTGAGQTIGIFELDNFLQSDLNTYATKAGVATVQNPTAMPIVTPQVVGSASLGNGQVEVTLDIELAQSMAPGATIIVFEGSTGITSHGDSVLHAMATSTPPLTIASSSWTYGWNQSAEQAVTEMAAQGVSFFQSSGDNGSIQDPTDNRDMQHQTLVGGTLLQTNTLGSVGGLTAYPNPYYASEATWTGSSGGIMNGGTQDCWPWPFCNSVSTGIPGYQVGVDMSKNGGSTTFRNFPDVAMDAPFTAWVNGSTNPQIGTSEATPLWAGFMALANQLGIKNGVGSVGFANPVLYAIGVTGNQPKPNLYSQSFNDIADGVSTGTFTSVIGYDLTTGWGSPTCGLITQLASQAPLNPTSFAEIQVHINNGDDGIRDDSIASFTITFNDGTPSLSNTFHPQNATGWDPKGAVHDLVPIAPANQIASSAIQNIAFTLTSTKCCVFNTCCDNWSIGGLDVRVLNPSGPEVCVFHGESAKNPDGSINTELGRLTNSNPTVTFTPGGCPSASGPPPPSTPVSEVIFIFGTGDDDLRQGSELDVAFFKPGSSTAFERGVLKASGAPKFDNNTQNTEVFTLTTGSHPLSDFGSIVISLNNSGNDEWHIFGINVMADTPGGPQNCLYNLQGQPLQVLNSGTPSMTLTPRSGCP